MPSDLERTQARFRAALLRRDAAASADLVRAYAIVWDRLQDSLAALTRRIAEAQADGVDVNRDWLRREARYRLLLDQTALEIARYGAYAEGRIAAEQQTAVTAAQTAARALIEAGMGPPPPGLAVSFAARLPSPAVQELVGTLADGSPLHKLLGRLGPEAARGVGDALVTGLALGEGSRTIARRVRADLDGNATRALVISRNETLRAYRTASLETYRANPETVRGWVWSAALTRRTCAVCWAQHGTEHPADEAFASHVSCRCAPLPLTRTWAELGFPNVRERRRGLEPGVDAFGRLTAAEQRQILGKGKWELYQAGGLALPDLVGRTYSRQWGRGLHERSLRELRAREA